MKLSVLLALLGALANATPLLDQTSQLSLGDGQEAPRRVYEVDPEITAALQEFEDPVDALLSIRPGLAPQLFEKRLLEIDGAQAWMTEGDKMRLRRDGKGFMDITEVRDRLPEPGYTTGRAHLPPLTQQYLVKTLYKSVSTSRMHDDLKHLTSFYTRFYQSTNGERSSRWLHDHIAQIIADSPFRSYISLSWHKHKFPQSSIIARFEPPLTTFGSRTTIVGAHQDSINTMFPLLPAPGADDDGSGTVSILEAFRVLAHHGFVPEEGPVEFHWYAGEEAGMLGSLDRATFARDSRMNVGAMLQLDMTAYVSRAAPEYLGILRTGADYELTKWLFALAQNYSSIPVQYIDLPGLSGSDHMSWTRNGFPSCAAEEGNPMAGGVFPGHMNNDVHTDRDRMDLDNEKGVFSIDVSRKYAAIDQVAHGEIHRIGVGVRSGTGGVAYQVSAGGDSASSLELITPEEHSFGPFVITVASL